MIRTRHIFILQGGLGNQLFQFSNLHRIVKENKSLAIIYYPDSDNAARTFSLGQLCKNCSHVSKVKNRRSFTLDFILKLRDFAVKRKMTFLIKIIEKLVFVELSQYKYSNYVPNVNIYAGYFQNWNYVSDVFAVLRQEIAEILEALCFSLPNFDDIHLYGVIHFRRGDLLEFENSMGILTDNYFLNAIEVARKDYGENVPLLVISDNKELATKVFSRFTNNIFGPSDLPEWNAFKVMSKAKFVITSNSTFSWWGALLSHSNGGTAYIPKPWFMNWKVDPGNAFIFPGFKTIPAEFKTVT